MPDEAAPPPPAPAAIPAERQWLLWLPLAIGALLALAYLEYVRQHIVPMLAQAEFGAETAAFASGADNRTQCQDAADNQSCIDAWRRAGQPPVALWFGNSQLMGINRFKQGDLNAPEILRRALAARGPYRLITYAEPNANLSEEEIVFDAIAPIYRPKLWILPICYDDIRELEIRPTVAAMRPAGVAAPDAEKGDKAAEPGRVETNQTVQARAEDAVTGALEAHWPLWRDRDNLRTTLGMAIHGARNQLAGIHSTSKRPVDPPIYRERMELLDKMVARARAAGVDVLLYAPPYRQDIDGPYLRDDYIRFKAELAALAARHGARFADLDPIVPGPEWATIVDVLYGTHDPDFMHFTGAGHRRLAAAIDAQIRAMGY